jgi:hypothetical protein
MNEQPGLERLVTDWLHAEVTTAGSDRVLAGALVRVATVEQVGRLHRHWPTRSGAFAGIAMLGALSILGVIGVGVVSDGQAELRAGAAVSSTPTPSASLPEVRRRLADVPGPFRGPVTLMIGDVPLSFIGPSGVGSSWVWEGFKDDLYISASTEGPQGAEAMVLWTSLPDSEPARPCLLPLSDAESVAALADAVATAPGTELVSGPTDVTVGGRPGKHVEVRVVALWDERGMPAAWEPGCDPAYFFGWEPRDAGAFWLETVPGDTIQAWIVRVHGTLLFIEAAVRSTANPKVEVEIDDMIDSIRFED